MKIANWSDGGGVDVALLRHLYNPANVSNIYIKIIIVDIFKIQN